MLRGARGQVAVFDLQDGTFMPSSEDEATTWNDYFHALTQFTDCRMSSTGMAPETGSEYLPE